jgi:hypothetical protein
LPVTLRNTANRRKISGMTTLHLHKSFGDQSDSAIRKWTPPARVFDWDSMMNHVRTASLRDGYDRYCEWHVTLKRKASDSDIAEQGFQSNEPNKRLRRA